MCRSCYAPCSPLIRLLINPALSARVPRGELLGHRRAPNKRWDALGSWPLARSPPLAAVRPREAVVIWAVKDELTRPANGRLQIDRGVTIQLGEHDDFARMLLTQERFACDMRFYAACHVVPLVGNAGGGDRRRGSRGRAQQQERPAKPRRWR